MIPSLSVPVRARRNSQHVGSLCTRPQEAPARPWRGRGRHCRAADEGTGVSPATALPWCGCPPATTSTDGSWRGQE